ncbi:hypothetical protein [Bradyrhizobium symbiodeficiens]|uniref:hypothetical protein n=1 Tax=Bradyrhizobium symbiodeficiens TaxID=1404367 RepID=UPI00140F5002|nr:hypothetical protein [Bradyrhizobium symbiodeficiens]QIO98863.1 hypothetical protein HAU86_03170 [Bradyrhizobium symbiodeficiens]
MERTIESLSRVVFQRFKQTFVKFDRTAARDLDVEWVRLDPTVSKVTLFSRSRSTYHLKCRGF